MFFKTQTYIVHSDIFNVNITMITKREHMFFANNDDKQSIFLVESNRTNWIIKKEDGVKVITHVDIKLNIS